MPSTVEIKSKAGAIFPATQHILPNGFTIYLSENKTKPRIYTEIAVRAGSKNDPDSSTGLAHYLEHMLFKGTSNLGSSDWSKEEPILKEIAETYEQHRNTNDEVSRKKLYHKIDQLSQEAAKYAIPGEYDRILAQIGAKGTNAYTWVDQTVFINDIPSTELGRWMTLEKERFSKLVLRLFHTELETVFEEFNISQDKDIRKVMREANQALFSPHPYGTHTTIGKGEHLKAPSHYDIYQFFEAHYVPANMAMVLVGDFDAKEVLNWATKTFGTWKAKPIPAFNPTEPKPKQQRLVQVKGNESEAVYLHWRIPGAKSQEYTVASVAAVMLHNNQAGLFDQALNQQQKVLASSAGIIPMQAYSTFRCFAKPKTNQSLEEAAQLVHQQIAKLADGDFPEWLRKAAMVDIEVSMNKMADSNGGRAQLLTSTFINRIKLEKALNLIEYFEKITDKDIQTFAQNYLKQTECITVEKIQEDDDTVIKVDKPDITPIPLLTDRSSTFAKEIQKINPEESIEKFSDLDKVIQKQNLRTGLDFHYLFNEDNQLFELLHVYEFGRNTDKWINFATKYLGYLGTGQKTNSQIQIDFYRLGLQWQIQASGYRVYVGVSGLNKHLPEAIELLDKLMNDCQPDLEKWKLFVEDIAQQRQNTRSNKQAILRKIMSAYAKFGDKAPSANSPTLTALRNKDPKDLVQSIHALSQTEKTIFYYGPTAQDQVAEMILAKHDKQSPLRSLSKIPSLAVQKFASDTVKFVHFPTVQVEILILRHLATGFDPKTWVLAEWYNQYYGLGLSSIVFQELRESRALAYSTYAYAMTPERADGHQFLNAFIGTQPDKLDTALSAMKDLLDNWKIDATAAERVKEGMLQKMRTERDVKQNQYWLWRQAQDRGQEGNPRAYMFEALQKATFEELAAFMETHKKPTTLLVLGDKDRIDFSVLAQYGEIEAWDLDTIFGNNLS